MPSNAMLSDTTSVTSPTPFSPFSSAFSNSSEATVISEQGEQADLGAFQSVFFALSQLQLHHSQQSTGHLPSHHRSSNDEHDDDDDDTGHPTPSTIPSILPISPFTLDPRISQPPSRSRIRPYGSTASSDTEGIPDGRQTADVGSDVILAPAPPSPSSAAEDGDEESAALTSPNSRPSSDEVSLPEEYRDSKEPDEEKHLWTYTETAPYHPSYRSDSTETDDPSMPGEDNMEDDIHDGPGLGSFESAFAFFAAERAKLALKVQNGRIPDPPELLPGLPIGNAKSFVGGGALGSRPEVGPPSVNSSYSPDSDLQQRKDPSSFGSPSSLEDGTNGRRKGQRGIIPRSTKQLFKPTKTTAADSPSPSNNRRRPNHRHTRSLPDGNGARGIPASAVATPPPLPESTQSRMQSLARSLTTTFPEDLSTLRRVIADPTTALGIGTYTTPSDDALVAGGFFDPASATDESLSRLSNTEANAETLLHVFMDHSNIFVGFLDWVKRQPNSAFSGNRRPAKPKLCHPSLALVIERGRRCLTRVLVASSPLRQSLNQLGSIGYQLSILQRVEVQEGSTPIRPTRNNSLRGISQSGSTSTLDSTSQSGTPRRQPTRGKGRGARGPQGAPGSDDDSERRPQGSPAAGSSPLNRGARRAALQHRRTASEALVTPSNSSNSIAAAEASKPRFREEAVDELLQLKLFQTVYRVGTPPPGSTLVLLTGDGARSQFNPEGFSEPVRRALELGWHVEIMGWESGRARKWTDMVAALEAGEIRGKEIGAKLTIHDLDPWGFDLLESR